MDRIFRIGGVIVVVVAILAAIISSLNSKPANADIVWDAETAVGSMEAENYFIIYSDIACPYCVAFENAIVENEEEFKKYIEENDILVEVRVSDFLYEYGESHSIESRYGAEAIYCAKNEGKFWDYYKTAVTTVWNDYFKSNGKSAFADLNSKDKKYWIQLGKKIGLGDEFESCVENDEPLEEIVKNAEKTTKLASGMPFFKFNKYTNSGFALEWGWEYVLLYFKAGLES